MDVDELRRLPPLAGLSEVGLQRLSLRAAELQASAGRVLALEGDAGAGMFILCDGSVEVELRSGKLELGQGDFFGELAALEWSAGYGYPRLATVVATSPVDAVVLPSETLNAMVRDAPGVAAIVWRAVRERLPRS